MTFDLVGFGTRPAERELVTALLTECLSCTEGTEEAVCPDSRRPCGHHCNHTWTHDVCDWCGQEVDPE